jgi:hypothetical protein
MKSVLFRNSGNRRDLSFVIPQRVFTFIFVEYVVIRHQRYFADVGCDNIHRLCQARRVAANGIPYQLRALFDRRPEMVDTGPEAVSGARS